jgi:hypothetical protein
MDRRVELLNVLNECEKKSQVRELTLGEACDGLGKSTYCFVGIVLCIPFLQPLSLGPIATAVAVAFILIGWQMIKDKPKVRLPARIRSMTFTPKVWKSVIGACRWLLNACSKFTRPRFMSLVTGKRGKTLCGLLFILGGVLLSVPLAGVPFNNFFPALCVFFACVAELEEDGLMLWVSLFWAIVSVLYFVLLGVLFIYLGEKAFDWVKALFQ